MKITSAIDGLALPTEVDFFYATNTGNIYAKFQDNDGAWIFADVTGEQFVASLVSANLEAKRVVTNEDIEHIVADVFKQALTKAGDVRIKPPGYKTKKQKQAA